MLLACSAEGTSIASISTAALDASGDIAAATRAAAADSEAAIAKKPPYSDVAVATKAPRAQASIPSTVPDPPDVVCERGPNRRGVAPLSLSG